MKEIIFATTNKGKIEEIQSILGNEYKVLSIKDLNIDIEIEEDGATFEENAIKKATEIMKITNKPTIADDSGLEIDYLNKEPGIHSARYLGEDTPYSVKNQKILERLKDIKKEERKARYICVIAVATTDGKTITTKATLEGFISEEAKGENGFGYDPIFFVPSLNKTCAELSLDEKNKISHRAKAFMQIKDKLKELN